MATPERPTETPARPAGVEGDGMEAYPTYHDGPAAPGRATASKPTDVNLPRSRRTYGLPILIGLGIFALVILIRIVWGGMNMATSTDDAMTPGDPASPPVSEGAPAPAGAAATQGVPTPLGEEQQQTTTGAGEVETAPGAIDVPGGDTTTPAGQAPAQ